MGSLLLLTRLSAGTFIPFPRGLLGWPLHYCLLLREQHALVFLLCGCFAVWPVPMLPLVRSGSLLPALSSLSLTVNCIKQTFGRTQTLFLYPCDIAYITKTVCFLWCLAAPDRMPKVGLFFCYQFDSAGLLPFPCADTLLWVLSSMAGTSSSTARTQLLWAYQQNQLPIQLQLTQQIQITTDRCSRAHHKCSWYTHTYSHLLTTKVPEQPWGCRTRISLTFTFPGSDSFPLPTASTHLLSADHIGSPCVAGNGRDLGAALRAAAGAGRCLGAVLRASALVQGLGGSLSGGECFFQHCESGLPHYGPVLKAT